MVEHEYGLLLHWKQGDDFHGCLTQSDSNVEKALLLWAEGFEKNAEHCRKLAERVQGSSITVEADTHMIEFHGDTGLLKKLAEEGLLEDFALEEV